MPTAEEGEEAAKKSFRMDESPTPNKGLKAVVESRHGLTNYPPFLPPNIFQVLTLHERLFLSCSGDVSHLEAVLKG